MNRVEFAQGGINPPHVHPRATELGRVARGQIYVDIIDTNNTFFSKVLQVGDSFVIPRGLLHFQYNVGEGEATQFVSFNSQEPGAQFVIQALFGSKPEILTEILARSFRVDAGIVEYIRSRIRDDDVSSEKTS
ncbi:hypothetical protein LUZ60_005203 [Juncus effusus]|nr:hypothetical protein LUZ60_005203 [Juncus effusus]